MDEAWRLAEGQHPHVFRKRIAKNCLDLCQYEKMLECGFLLFLPKGYNSGDERGNERGKKWPLIVFMHGMGESGTDLDLLKLHGLPKIVERQADFPFIVISPQAPSAQEGVELDFDILNGLLDEALARLPVDEARVYLTGMSMGGFATWAWGAASADRFAAIAPVCGGGNAADAPALKSTPIWAFHGALDEVVPARGSRDMVAAVNACGGHAELTEYAGVGHDAWSASYADPALYAWFLRHAKASG